MGWIIPQRPIKPAEAYQIEKAKREFNTPKKKTGRPCGPRKHVATTFIRVSARTKAKLKQSIGLNDTYDEFIDRLIESKEIQPAAAAIVYESELNLKISKLTEERDLWEREAKRWKEVYNNSVVASARRIAMLESELRSRDAIEQEQKTELANPSLT